MAANIIGEKEIFAIEYNISGTKNMGNIRIWIRNNYIGAFEDNIFLDSFVNAMSRIKNLSNNDFVKVNLQAGVSETNAKLLLNTNKINALIGLPENFDDFIIRVFEYNSMIYFFWQIVPKPYFSYEEYDNNKAIFFSYIEKSVFNNVMNEFKMFSGVGG